jgi:hypothetical protein
MHCIQPFHAVIKRCRHAWYGEVISIVAERIKSFRWIGVEIGVEIEWFVERHWSMQSE